MSTLELSFTKNKLVKEKASRGKKIEGRHGLLNERIDRKETLWNRFPGK